MSHKTETHQNISVWARRFRVEIKNIDRAAEVADRFYGRPSRKASVAVVAMKVVEKHLGWDMGNRGTFYGGLAMATIVYKATYDGGVGTVAEAYAIFEETIKICLDEGYITGEVYSALESSKGLFIGAALDAIAARNKEKLSTVSITDAILAKARG